VLHSLGFFLLFVVGCAVCVCQACAPFKGACVDQIALTVSKA
jgi:hypothetical protein